METKKHITLKLEKKGVSCSIARLNRYLSGDRTPNIEMAREISQVIRCKKEVFLDKANIAQRMAAIKRYAKRNKLDLYVGPGNPQWRKS